MWVKGVEKQKAGKYTCDIGEIGVKSYRCHALWEEEGKLGNEATSVLHPQSEHSGAHPCVR